MNNKSNGESGNKNQGNQNISEEYVRAATLFQALYRGHLARVFVKSLRESNQGLHTPKDKLQLEKSIRKADQDLETRDPFTFPNGAVYKGIIN